MGSCAVRENGTNGLQTFRRQNKLRSRKTTAKVWAHKSTNAYVRTYLCVTTQHREYFWPNMLGKNNVVLRWRMYGSCVLEFAIMDRRIVLCGMVALVGMRVDGMDLILYS